MFGPKDAVKSNSEISDTLILAAGETVTFTIKYDFVNADYNQIEDLNVSYVSRAVIKIVGNV